MKVAGALTLTVGITLALVLAMWPAKVTVLGSTGTCGPAALIAFADDDGDDEIASECKYAARGRIAVAFVVLAGAVLGGSLMILNAPASVPSVAYPLAQRHR